MLPTCSTNENLVANSVVQTHTMAQEILTSELRGGDYRGQGLKLGLSAASPVASRVGSGGSLRSNGSSSMRRVERVPFRALRTSSRRFDE